MPPCTPWIEAEDVADCCGIHAGSHNHQDLQEAADNASAILYELTGHRYPGACERTVRPIGRHLCFAPWGQYGGHRHRLSRVKLAGHVTAITEVTIDGTAVDPGLYRLDQHRYLTRMADPDGKARHWPQTQRLDLPSSEPGTFSVTYEYGTEPPGPGVQAASALACELYRACPAPGDNPGECALPRGVKRIVRQGVTVETINAVATTLSKGATGLLAVDAFLSTYGGKTRKSAVWSPDVQPFAQPEGTTSGS